MSEYSNQQVRAMAASAAAVVYTGQGPVLGGIKGLTDEIAEYIAEGPDPYKANLGCATTRELLMEVATRMKLTQNSTAGRELGVLCQKAVEELAQGVLNYKTMSS